MENDKIRDFRVLFVDIRGPRSVGPIHHSSFTMSEIRVCNAHFEQLREVKNGQLVGHGEEIGNLYLQPLKGMNYSFVREVTSGNLLNKNKRMRSGGVRFFSVLGK